MPALGSRRPGRLGRFLTQSAAELALQARGDVLQLGLAVSDGYGPAVRSLRRLEDLAELDTVGELDTVVSVCALWRSEWSGERLASLAERLRPGGQVLFAEPIAVTGASGVVQRLARPVTVACFDLAFDRLVVDDLRATGLVATSVVRTSLDPIGRVRTIACGVAAARR